MSFEEDERWVAVGAAYQVLHGALTQLRELEAGSAPTSTAAQRVGAAAAKNTLRQLENAISKATANLDEALEEAEIAVDEQEEEGDVQQAAATFQEKQQDCRRIREEVRSLKLACLKNIAAQHNGDRDALLGGATRGGSLSGSGTRASSSSGGAGGAKLSAEDEAKQQLEQQRKRTQEMRRIRAEMQAETGRSTAALTAFDESTQKLLQTGDVHDLLTEKADVGKGLLTQMSDKEKQDRLMIGGAFGVFFSVVFYVVAKRLPFVCRMVFAC